ncbi:MAG: hypothetical protein WCD38_12080 [Candidatus Tumulicola sp.]
MRRLAGLIASAALAVALVPRIASASPHVAGTASFDLPAQVMMRIFGESADASAALAAAYGDRISESPLRDLALGTAPALRSATFERRPGSSPTFASSRNARFVASDGAAFDLAQSVGAPLLRSNLRFAVTPQSDDDASARDDAARISATTFTAGQYQPVARVTLVSPQSGAFSLGGLVHGTAPTVAASSALAFGESGTIAGSAGSVQAVPSSVRLGPLKFTTRLESASMAAPSVGLNDDGAAAGANLDVRAGARTLTFGLSSDYERLTRSDSSGLTPATLGDASSWQLPGAGVPLAVPNYANMSKVSLGAGVAVPVLSGLTLNLDYAADRLFGGYGLPGLSNLDAIDNSYGGKLTFQIPNSSSTLSVSARQLRYLDSLIPVNTTTETREDVNFTVKF